MKAADNPMNPVRSGYRYRLFDDIHDPSMTASRDDYQSLSLHICHKGDIVPHWVALKLTLIYGIKGNSNLFEIRYPLDLPRGDEPRHELQGIPCEKGRAPSCLNLFPFISTHNSYVS